MHFSCVPQKLPGIYIKSFLINSLIPIESGLLVWDTLPPYQSSYEIFTPNSEVIYCRYDMLTQNKQPSAIRINYKHFDFGENSPKWFGVIRSLFVLETCRVTHEQVSESRWAICDELWEDTADCKWVIILWTQDVEDCLWLVHLDINHAIPLLFFFPPTSQTVSVLKKTLSYLIVLSTLQFCWPVNKEFQNDNINYYFPRVEQRQPPQILTWGGMKAFIVQKW